MFFLKHSTKFASTILRSQSLFIPLAQFSVKKAPIKDNQPSQPKQNYSSRKTEELPYLELTRDFVDPKQFYNLLLSNDINFFTGVPDSLLKDFCAYVKDNTPPTHNIITPNEGLAISLASGYYMATKKIPLVYMQNSGLGNAINPIMSLAHNKVFSIPMIILIGWRGEPGKKDEPQHMIQGKVMNGLLTEMGIQYEVMPDYIEGVQESIETAIHTIKRKKAPYAFVVKRQTFLNYDTKTPVVTKFEMSREKALQLVMGCQGKHDVIISTTGFTSREVYEIRKTNNESNNRDLLCVGSMGHASSIALGVAMTKKSRDVWCFDGDGAAIMHMGAFSLIGQIQPQNFKHIILNNYCHDSVGAQPTAGNIINFPQVALANGYKFAYSVSTEKQLKEILPKVKSQQGPILLEIKVRPGARKNLGRPKQNPQSNKEQFMEFLDY